MFQFDTVTAHSRLYNFHSHTQFCDGHAPMEDFVVEAIAEGFTDYGFSPHSPIPFQSSCNMSREAVPAYLAEYNRLKSVYGDKINLYAAMEIDYINGDWGPSSAYFDSIPLDYRIGSVHFIPSFDNPAEFVDIDGKFVNFKVKMEKYFHGDIRAVVESFFRQTQAMIAAGGFQIIGHFDKIGHNGGHYQEGIEDEPWFERLFMDTFNAIMDHHLIVEVNTKAWDVHHRFFPNLKYFDLLRRYDVPILVNSDAHYPTAINAGRDDAMRLLHL
ncbi:MAG: histidinol-phosphatase [Muribaculaceae bacterium]|jgi:histidinol-phosphatase (PHP family)|nr:histidinol-phosphatase [Muribaculaceae bacterium]